MASVAALYSRVLGFKIPKEAFEFSDHLSINTLFQQPPQIKEIYFINVTGVDRKKIKSY